METCVYIEWKMAGDKEVCSEKASTSLRSSGGRLVNSNRLFPVDVDND